MTRLMGGAAGDRYTYGRLEIFDKGFWSNVCRSDRFTPASAQVACRALGYDGGTAPLLLGSFRVSLRQVRTPASGGMRQLRRPDLSHKREVDFLNAAWGVPTCKFIVSCTRVYHVEVWFGFVRLALLFAVILCWVDRCLVS